MKNFTMIGNPGTTLSCASGKGALTGQGTAMFGANERRQVMTSGLIAPRRHRYDGTLVSLAEAARPAFNPSTADLVQIKQFCVPLSRPERSP